MITCFGVDELDGTWLGFLTDVMALTFLAVLLGYALYYCVLGAWFAWHEEHDVAIGARSLELYVRVCGREGEVDPRQVYERRMAERAAKRHGRRHVFRTAVR